METTPHSHGLFHLRILYRNWLRRLRYWTQDDLSEVSQSMLLRESRLPRALRFTMVSLTSATALFILWAAVTDVKELARTEGQVLPTGYSRMVQHLEGGLVRSIEVHEGDFVLKDQLLVQLDGAGTEEDFREQQLHVESLALQAERLHAMLEGREPDFSATGAPPEIIAEQKRIFESARASRLSDLSVIDQQIDRKKKAIQRLEQSYATSKSNLSVAQENKKIYADLSSKGLASRTAYLKKQQELNSQQGEVNSFAQQIEEGRKELSEFEHRRQAMEAAQRDQSYNELHKVESELAQARENLKKRNDRVARLEVRAPVAGYVKGLAVNTIGSVIPAGQTLMEIVPVDEQLIVEARILPQQVGRVAVGQEVRVKVDSYDYVRFGAIPGRLESISAMTFTDEARRQDYFKGRVRLVRNYAGERPGAHLVLPGMTVDADIVTGEKSVLGYLLKPIRSAVYNSLAEQ